MLVLVTCIKFKQSRIRVFGKLEVWITVVHEEYPVQTKHTRTLTWYRSILNWPFLTKHFGGMSKIQNLETGYTSIASMFSHWPKYQVCQKERIQAETPVYVWNCTQLMFCIPFWNPFLFKRPYIWIHWMGSLATDLMCLVQVFSTLRHMIFTCV